MTNLSIDTFTLIQGKHFLFGGFFTSNTKKSYTLYIIYSCKANTNNRYTITIWREKH